MKNLIRFQKPNETIFLICGCHSEVLVINYDYNTKIADLSLFENYDSYRHKLSFWHKIKTIIQILTKGTVYTDQITLEKTQLDVLKEYLSNL